MLSFHVCHFVVVVVVFQLMLDFVAVFNYAMLTRFCWKGLMVHVGYFTLNFSDRLTCVTLSVKRKGNM